MSIKNTIFGLAAAVILAGCLPARLAKYQKNNSGKTGQPAADANSGYSSSTKAAKAKPKSKSSRSSIYAIDKRMFRFALKEDDVWDSALSVLLRNYNVTIVDRKSGIITTEWDSFYLNTAVYRNKISLRIARTNYNTTDVTIHNNVERLRDASQAAGAVGAVWLPSEDEAGEVARVIQNMALLLNQPPPVLPPGMALAKDVMGDTPTSK